MTKKGSKQGESNRSGFREAYKNLDKPLLIEIILLVIIGCIFILSASSRESVARYDYSSSYFFLKHLFWIGLSLFSFIFIINIDTKWYKLIAPFAWFIVAALIISLFIYGALKRGSLNWLPFGGQPSEFAKPIIIIALACMFERFDKILLRNPDNPKVIRKIFILWLIIGCLIPAIVFIQKDLGTAIIIGLISYSLFLKSSMKKSYKINCTAILFAVGVLALGGIYLKTGKILSQMQLERFNYYNPCSKYESNGYQICNGFIAMNRGDLFGVGLSNSTQKYSYIPDPHTDSIFAIVVEECGFVTGVFIILLYFLIIKRLIRISNNAYTYRGKYIAFGAAIYLFIHIFLNLGGLLGLIPLTGVPLPLISYGGSFALSFLCIISITQRIAIETKIHNNKMKLV